MHGSDWRKFLKDRGGLIAAAFWAGLFIVIVISLGRSWQWEAEYQAARNAANYAEDAKNDVAIKCVRLTGQAFDDCSDEIDDPAREHQRNEYDLAAQQVVAIWTAVMGGMAVVGVALSALGVYLIWTTFKETKRSAEAAHASVLVTRRVGEAQTRAYVSIVGAAVIEEDSRSHLVLSLKNFGSSPVIAYRAIPRISLMIGGEVVAEDDGNTGALGLKPGWGLDIPAGETGMIKHLLRINVFEHVRRAGGNQATVDVLAMVGFLDVFGRTISDHLQFIGSTTPHGHPPVKLVPWAQTMFGMRERFPERGEHIEDPNEPGIK